MYILLDDTWSEGTSMTDLSSDGFNTVPIDGVGNLPVTMIWRRRLTIGQYDIVFDANQDGIYQSGVDVVDDPGDPVFEVFCDPPGSGGSAPVFPNIYIGIAVALSAGALAYLVRNTLAKRTPPHS